MDPMHVFEILNENGKSKTKQAINKNCNATFFFLFITLNIEKTSRQLIKKKVFFGSGCRNNKKTTNRD